MVRVDILHPIVNASLSFFWDEEDPHAAHDELQKLSDGRLCLGIPRSKLLGPLLSDVKDVLQRDLLGGLSRLLLYLLVSLPLLLLPLLLALLILAGLPC